MTTTAAWKEVPWAQDATPVEQIRVRCPLCSNHVTVPVVREFVHVLRRVCAAAGVQLAQTLPVIAYRCSHGHVVVLTLDKLQAVA